MKMMFSGTLLPYLDSQKEITLQASTVREALDALIEKYPRVEPMLRDARGEIRTTHRLFLNHSQLDRSELDASLENGDLLQVVTAIAGG